MIFCRCARALLARCEHTCARRLLNRCTAISLISRPRLALGRAKCTPKRHLIADTRHHDALSKIFYAAGFNMRALFCAAHIMQYKMSIPMSCPRIAFKARAEPLRNTMPFLRVRRCFAQCLFCRTLFTSRLASPHIFFSACHVSYLSGFLREYKRRAEFADMADFSRPFLTRAIIFAATTRCLRF